MSCIHSSYTSLKNNCMYRYLQTVVKTFAGNDQDFCRKWWILQAMVIFAGNDDFCRQCQWSRFLQVIIMIFTGNFWRQIKRLILCSIGSGYHLFSVGGHMARSKTSENGQLEVKVQIWNKWDLREMGWETMFQNYVRIQLFLLHTPSNNSEN